MSQSPQTTNRAFQFPWRTVTGSDFARSIRWARTQPTLRDIIKQITNKKP